ncbi:hypothetical protein CJ030_MR3G017008 [Morella rubra]|uniref:Acetyltransferase n=1 Tax=Morella rubra TaxID=262757 RepID=A0A6A1W4L6_9ROSI|nr:hypothetical protein CJ030_MR3G017008 [Morella rubra]
MSNPPRVRHISECFIKPQHALEESKRPFYLTPWDLNLLNANYIQKGLLFTKSPAADDREDSIKTLLGRLKRSLSVTLVDFYPLAGRLVTKKGENPPSCLISVDCAGGPGARFIHAALDMTISDILSPVDVPSVVQSFFDHDRALNYDGQTMPLLSIQVTELEDGIFLGCSMNHCIADGTSYWHFFNNWSEIFQAEGNKVSITRPPILIDGFLMGYGPIINLPFTDQDEFISRIEAPKLRDRMFHFTSESIARLKANANAEYNTNEISSFQSLSALVWRCITRARGPPHDQVTRCWFATNNRSRLDPPLSPDYFGNSLHAVAGVATAVSLVSNMLGFSTIRCMMGSSPRFNMYGNEFGMGKAIALRSGYANKVDGKVSSYPGYEGGGSIDLEVCLPADSMCVLESDEEFMNAVSVFHQPHWFGRPCNS